MISLDWNDVACVLFKQVGEGSECISDDYDGAFVVLINIYRGKLTDCFYSMGNSEFLIGDSVSSPLIDKQCCCRG